VSLSGSKATGQHKFVVVGSKPREQVFRISGERTDKVSNGVGKVTLGDSYAVIVEFDVSGYTNHILTISNPHDTNGATYTVEGSPGEIYPGGSEGYGILKTPVDLADKTLAAGKADTHILSHAPLNKLRVQAKNTVGGNAASILAAIRSARGE